MTVSPSYLPWPRCVACWIAGPRSGWNWGPRGSGVLTAAAREFPIYVDVEVEWAPGHRFRSASHPAQASYRSDVLFRYSSRGVLVLKASVLSHRGWRVGHRPPALPGLRAATWDPDCGPLVLLRPQAGRRGRRLIWLGVLAAKARVPSAHLAGLNARMLTECTRTLSRGQCWGTLSPAGCWNTVRPLALWACRLVRGGGKTELGRLWWGSPLSDAFALHLGAGPEAGGRGYVRGGTEVWWAGPFLGWGRSLGGGAVSAAQAGG